MKLFDFLKSEPKTDKELQAELKALVDKVVGIGILLTEDGQKYERLLKEIYSRGLEPETKIIRQSINHTKVKG